MPGNKRCWCNTPKKKELPFCSECTETIKLLRESRAATVADTLHEYNRRHSKERKL